MGGDDRLLLFYEEPDPDRWVPFDRYPRRALRRLMRGPARPGGQMRVFLNLVAGLDRLGVPYRVNDYAYARLHPEELACVLGKPFLLDRVKWRNPILFGACVHSHPLCDPHLLQRKPVMRVLVPGEWMRAMFEPYYGAAVQAWPVGIDTTFWVPTPSATKDVDVLLYDKVRWEHDRFERELIAPIREELERAGRSVVTIRYGHYDEREFHHALGRARSMVFLCEHETQGIAYQQALSCGVPILAWDRGGPWQDPQFYPERVRFGPVSSVPYWDARCGDKFGSAADFPMALGRFWPGVASAIYAPRDYILENLTLEHCAEDYLRHVNEARRLATTSRPPLVRS